MKMKKTLVDVTLVSTAVIAMAIAIFVVLNQVSFATVTSRSMEPTIKVGDMIVSRSIATSEIKPGDILILPLPEDGNLRYVHRIIEVDQREKSALLTTKGDANPSADSWRTEVVSAKAPKVFAILPTSHLVNGVISQTEFLYLLVALSLILILRSLLIYRKNNGARIESK